MRLTDSSSFGLSYQTIGGLSLVQTISAITPGFPYGSQKVRGVNLGGWLVLEVRAFQYLPGAFALLTT